jgi:N-acetylmuramoyl-L-alanine amidase
MKKMMIVLLSITLVIIAGGIVLKGQAYEDTKSDNNTRNNDALLEGKTIVIDPGHGGRDGGTTGIAHGTIEKELNLKVAKNIREELKKRTGATVILTREDDSSLLGDTKQKEELQARIDLAQEHNADLYISIHHDAFEDKEVQGITTYYGKNKRSDKKLAEIIQDAIFNQNIETRDRGAKAGNYHVLRESQVPAVLVELGFTSNEKDENRMNSEEFQTKSKKGIVDGIIEYFTT